MAITEGFEPAKNILSGGFSNLLTYAYFLIPIVILVTGFLIVFVIKKIRKKKTQWTHTLIVRRIIDAQKHLSKPEKIRMRRYPLIQGSNIFELEKYLLGGLLIPELEEYSGLNEFSIVLDRNNRIYINKGEIFNPDSSSVLVSARHAEIDLKFQQLTDNFKKINHYNKKLEWASIAKYAFMSIALVVIMIVSIVAIQKWGESREAEAEMKQAEALAMENLAKAITTMESTTKIQEIQLKYLLEQLYGKNLTQIINTEVIQR